jgi:CRP-like cAMP-binding protein
VVAAESGTRVLVVPSAAFASVVRRRPALVEEMAQTIAWRHAAAVAAAEAGLT